MKEREIKNKREDRKIDTRSVVLSVLIILFFLSVLFVSYNALVTRTRENIITRGELNAMTSAGQIDSYLSKGVDTIKLVCYTLDDMIHAGRANSEIQAYLVSESNAMKSTTLEDTSGVYGYINGEYLDGNNWSPDSDYVPTDRPWYIDAKAYVGRVAVVDPYVDLQTDTMMITFSKTLCDAKSVAAMDFSIEPLQKIAEDISVQDGSEQEIVLDRNYRVIAHSDRSEVGRNYLSETGTFGRELVDHLRTARTNYFSIRFEGSEYIVYSTRVSNDWYCLSVANATVAFRQLRQLLLVSIIVGLTVIAIVIFILIRSNKRQTQFARLSIHTIEALAAAIDAKDKYTSGHSGRVAEYAREIGRRYGYSKSRQNELYMMGLLHDVGKIGIPDYVINKPGRLTSEEFELIKDHPKTGVSILEKTEEMPRMTIGAHWHHERYDGKGYPDGLSGKDIPEEARIIAVADAYDAMTSSRSYRGILSQAFVREEIEKGEGNQFDPEFAKIMLQMIDEDKEYKLHGQ